jgi:cysteine-rich repeat protein
MTSRGHGASLSRLSPAQFAPMAALLAFAVLLGGTAYGICGNGTVDLGEDCDDGNNVDGDCCSAACAFESMGSPCSGVTLCRQSGACDGSGACQAVPRMNCRTALKSRVQLIDNNGNDAKDKLSWKWGAGQATSLEDFGVPTGTTNYALCIYAANSLIEEPEIPADPLLWEPVSTTGYKYRNRDAAEGIQKVRLRAGADFKSKLLVKGKGTNLPDPALDLPLPVTVQLVNSANRCFEAEYDSAAVDNNNVARFKATLP